MNGSFAQETTANGKPVKAEETDASTVSFRTLPRHFLTDQKTIWAAPAHVQPQDANWMVPLGILVGGSIASDRWVPGTLNLSPKTNSRFDTLSTLGVGGMVAAGGGMYLLGHLRHDDYQSRAGFLAGEAMVDSLAVGETLKFAFGRERPGTGSGRNKFFQGGNSFPSGHSIIAWSAAGAFTQAYPRWGSKMLFFGGATAISLSRIFANKHAPSDVIVGSTLGYLIGRHVYRSHTVDQEIARQFGTFKQAPRDHYDEAGTPSRGSVYVPMDSWVYRVFDRLAAMGYVKSALLGLRPWTRDECERLVDEIPPTGEITNPVAQSLVSELRAEFSERESPDFQGLDAGVDSLYMRTTGISGKPLANDLDFGSTIVNDYGRPFQEGFNAITGGSAHAIIGPLAFYVRAEYQHAPEAPALPLAARLAIQEATQNRIPSLNPIPLPPDIATPQLNRLHFLDAYVGWNFANWELSFGKQTLWWGPGAMGPMLISDNADPIMMARLSRTKPFTLPGVFKLLGPIRTEFFIGRLSGQHWVHVPPYTNVGSWTQTLSDQPYITGQKISLKPTPNLEIGVSRTGLFGGPAVPVTAGRLKTVLFSFSTSNGLTTDPGDRRTSFDFNYRIPGLRKWLVLYADSFAEDEINPIAYPRRSAMNPGIFIPQLPKLRHVELRAEASYTDLPGFVKTGYFYWNLHYISGYTNNDHLIGDWVGRQGKALQFSSAYWFTGHNRVEVAYRKLSVNPDTGRRGTQQDLRATVDWQLSHSLQASGWVQHERWNFPVLAPTPVSNTSVSFQLIYTPKWHLHR